MRSLPPRSQNKKEKILRPGLDFCYLEKNSINIKNIEIFQLFFICLSALTLKMMPNGKKGYKFGIRVYFYLIIASKMLTI